MLKELVLYKINQGLFNQRYIKITFLKLTVT